MARWEDSIGARRAGSAVTRSRGGAAPRGGDEPFVEARIWLNVGVIKAKFTDEDGVERELFLSLPGKGIPLDQLRLPNENSNSKRAQAELNLWNQFMAYCQKIPPGETEILAEAVVQARHVQQESQVDAATNPFMVEKVFG